jgi:hypothetical protein
MLHSHYNSMLSSHHTSQNSRMLARPTGSRHCSLLNEEGIATPNSTSQHPQLKRHIITRSHLQNISKAAERTGRVDCNCHQQHSSLPLAVTVVPLIPNHVTCIALVISLIVQRSLDCIRVAFWAVVARELLPRSFPVFARFCQVPDHHTDVSFAEFVRCADAFSPGPSVGCLDDRSWERSGTPVSFLMALRVCPSSVSTLTLTRVGVSHSCCLGGSRSGVGERIS